MDWITSYFFKVAENSRPASISNWKGVFYPVDRNVPRKPRPVGGELQSWGFEVSRSSLTMGPSSFQRWQVFMNFFMVCSERPVFLVSVTSAVQYPWPAD